MTGDVALTKPDKELVPARDGHAAVTKADAFGYASRIASTMLPWIADRPAVLQRFPDGIDGDGWYQKHTPKHFPAWIRRVAVPSRRGSVQHPVIDSREALQYVVNQGTLSIHILGGRVEDLDHPRELLIDLDPSVDDAADVVSATRRVRGLLDDLDVIGFVKTTGSRGVHIHLPLTGSAEFAAVAALSRALADELVRRHPAELTVAFSKDERGDRLFVDVLRNAPAQHAVAPFTLRPKPGAPVAVPLHWDEVNAGWTPDATPLKSLFRRLGALTEDPWAGFDAARLDAADIASRLQRLTR